MTTDIKKGFILTRQVFENRQGMQLCYWLKTDDGPVKLTIDNEKAVFFVHTEQIDLCRELLINAKIGHQIKPLSLKTFTQKNVCGVYFQSLTTFYQARDLLRANLIKCFEDDIRPEDRYLMERYINGSMAFVGNQQVAVGYSNVFNSKAKSIEYTPKLSMLSVDIECSFEGDLYSIGAYGLNDNNDVIKKVIMIGEPEPNSSDYIQWVEDEYDLLMTFITWLNQTDPDIIIGWNVINFDFRLLQKRCDINNIKFAIGRDGSSPFWRKNKMSPEQHFILIAGRVVLDGIDLLRSATYSFPSFSLEYVSQELLGVGKDIEDVENRVAEINRKFLYEKQKLASYNLEDCRLVWLIFEKTQLLDFAVLRSALTGLELDRIGGSVAAFTNLYLPKLHRAGYVAPNMGDGESDLVSPGGFVMDSTPGLYKNVLVLDFKSLYPSIIRTFKIDPMGMIEGLLEYQSAVIVSDEIKDVQVRNATKSEAIEGFDGAYFSRDKHFLPEIIETLWAERDKAKQQKNAPLSQAIKIIMNSFYGVLGSNGCRFFDPRLSGSITKRSHQLLNLTKDWIEELGYSVIYGDTDSIFVSVGEDKTDKQSQEIGKELMALVNSRMDSELFEKYQIESKLEIEFETHFHQFLMPTVRGLDVGTKKRYAGLVGRGSDEKLIFKGLESVRTDWTELAKEFQRTLYLKVFKGEPVEEYVRDMVTRTLNGEFDDKLIYRKRLRRKLVEYEKNVPPHVKAGRHADELNKSLGKPLRYQNKGWIEYVMTVNGPQTKEHLTANIDYPLYIERQLGAVADGILPFINKYFADIIDEQMQLFE